MQASDKRVLLQDSARGLDQYWVSKMFNDPVVFCVEISAMSRGRDPTRV